MTKQEQKLVRGRISQYYRELKKAISDDSIDVRTVEHASIRLYESVELAMILHVDLSFIAENLYEIAKFLERD